MPRTRARTGAGRICVHVRHVQTQILTHGDALARRANAEVDPGALLARLSKAVFQDRLGDPHYIDSSLFPAADGLLNEEEVLNFCGVLRRRGLKGEREY